MLGARQPEENVRPVVPVNQRATQLEAMLLGYIAENDMPFTAAASLLELMKAGAKDKKALGEVKLNRQSASYKMVHGVSKTLSNALGERLKQTNFSLNIDEATTKSQKKVLAVLVSYFHEDKKKIVIEHLETFEVVRADAQSIYSGIVGVFDKFGLPWNNLVSVLMDSCNTMRGEKSGVETLIRSYKAPHLLDIDGDSVHHAHNAAKAFCKPFEGWLERLFIDIHTDFHWSTDLREKLSEICHLCEVKFTIPERFLNHRFLSAYSLAADTLRLLDAYTLFYSSFVKKEDQSRFNFYREQVIIKKAMSEAARNKLAEIDIYLKKKAITVEGKARKTRIIDCLFRGRRRTRLLLAIYIGVLHQLKEYVMLFQRKDPHIHLLNDSQRDLLKGYLGLFIKPEDLPTTVKEMKRLDVSNTSIHLAPRTMFVGNSSLLKARKDEALSDVKIVLGQLKIAYISSSRVLLTKMPIDNRVLKHASALDPAAHGHSITLSYLKELPNSVKNVLGNNERSSYDREVHQYVSDPCVPQFVEGSRVDSWWAEIAQRYPVLGKLALACFTCFHGPMIEGVFNSMGDVCDVRAGSMDTSTLSAIQTTKYHLKAAGVSAVKYFEREDVLYSPVQAALVQNIKKASGDYRQHVQNKRQERDLNNNHLGTSGNRPASKTAALEMIGGLAKRQRKEHVDCVENDSVKI